MNFTREIKRELAPLAPADNLCALAQFSALLFTSGSMRGGSTPCFEFTSENERVVELFLGLAEQIYGIRLEVKEATLDPKRESDKLTFFYSGERARRILKEVNALAADRLFGDAAICYARGAFLGSGSCTLPRGGSKTGYHLEFAFPSRTSADRFRRLLEQFELISKSLVRGERYVVYFKSREAISDFFSVVGANAAIKQLDEVSAAREESNRLNRVENCMAGNADKAAIASAEQVIALRELARCGGLMQLDEPLKSTAEARLTSPELSLKELAKKLNISKGGLQHRMRKLMEICAEKNKGERQ